MDAYPRKGFSAMTVFQALTLAIAFATLIITIDRKNKK
ncbi:putative holin-like toxin [Candidatus Enterococcus ferrettii]|nr:putative holin-like toxin [Enterococcus sp. 665A]